MMLKSWYLICILASLRTRRTSFPLSSSSLVRVLMVSLSEWISWSRSAIRFLLQLTSCFRSDKRPRRSCSWRGNPQNPKEQIDFNRMMAVRLNKAANAVSINPLHWNDPLKALEGFVPDPGALKICI